MRINEKSIREAMNRRLSVLVSTPESRIRMFERMKKEYPDNNLSKDIKISTERRMNNIIRETHAAYYSDLKFGKKAE